MIRQLPATTTGHIVVNSLLGLPYSTLSDLQFDDRRALWAGCLDATDRLLTGSTVNLVDSSGSWTYGNFVFRAL